MTRIEAHSLMTTTRAALPLLALLFLGDAQPASRLRAAGLISFYVSPNGSADGKESLVQEMRCRTIQNAVLRAMNDWDFAGRGDPIIRLAPGTYEEGVSVAGQPVGAHTINIVGQQS